jgi:hypothetical protein
MAGRPARSGVSQPAPFPVGAQLTCWPHRCALDLDGGVLRVRVSLKQQDGKPVLADLKTERSKRTLEMPAAVRSVLRALQR